MGQQDQLITEYYSLNRDKVIDCPFQPGNLKISKRVCLKRLKAADQITKENNNSTDIFNYFVSQGLLRCKKCSIIKEDSFVNSPSVPPAKAGVQNKFNFGGRGTRRFPDSL
jgi:hypothetical protein